VARIELARRVEAYIANVEQAIEKLRGSISGAPAKLVELAEAYLNDAKYYLERGDGETALAAIAYAEGLIDALRWLGLAKFEWEPLSKLLSRPKVVVAGTFDILHPGHLALLRYAYSLGRVYVIVARDENVRRFKGREPLVPEDQRLEVISSIRYVHRAVLGHPQDVLQPIEAIRPDIIVLGPDQWASEDWLSRSLEERGVSPKIIRFRERVECNLCSVTSIACRVLNAFPRSLCRS
jgi:FAD synthetase